MVRVRPIGHEERLSPIEHLDELRTRILILLGALAIAFGLCLWQDELLLEIANRPLPAGYEPITLGVAEPFITTLTLAAYGALVLILPLLLYQGYAFVLPAFTPAERRVIVPLLLMVPFLFVAGVTFAYYVIVPAALDFLLNFNDSEFDIQVRAREYYGFFAMTLISVGVLFQVPVGVLAVTRLGLVTPDQLAANRRYAILAIAVIAMLLPGTDPVTMVISMMPLVALYELSIVMARFLGKPATDGEDDEAVPDGPVEPTEPTEPTD